MRRPKFWRGLAPSIFEIFLQKIFWWGFRPIPVTHWQENQISLKKWRFEIFGIAAPSRRSPLVIHGLSYKVLPAQLIPPTRLLILEKEDHGYTFIPSYMISMYSGAHKRSDAYSDFLSKPQLFSIAWWTFQRLLPTWQSGSKQILIGGCQKLHFSFCTSHCHMKAAPHMNTFDFFS